MSLIILLILSEDDSFNRCIHEMVIFFHNFHWRRKFQLVFKTLIFSSIGNTEIKVEQDKQRFNENTKMTVNSLKICQNPELPIKESQ